MSDLSIAGATGSKVVDDRIRGFPAGHAPLPLDEVATQGWKPFDGVMSLPLISFDREAFRANTAAMMKYVSGNGIAIAPHAKTPMSPALARDLVEAGAWGTTVADIRQASVMLKAGLNRLILANQVGGSAAAGRLAALLLQHPGAEIHVFVDSVDAAVALADVWDQQPELPPLGLLVELGAGRGGARSLDAANGIFDTILARETGQLRLSGVAAYEGAAATADPAETAKRISDLMQMVIDLHAAIRARIGTQRNLILTAGGSAFFDIVVQRLKSLLSADAHAQLILRSGAIFFHDHGVYERGLNALDQRDGFAIGDTVELASNNFRPSLRLWAEVLSRPEPSLAICGMGMRDVAMDQGLPRPLALYRNGASLRVLDGVAVVKLNDQHSFIDLGGETDVRMGDVVEFGISHPCTCLDRHAILYGLDAAHVVTAALTTSFG